MALVHYKIQDIYMAFQALKFVQHQSFEICTDLVSYALFYHYCFFFKFSLNVSKPYNSEKFIELLSQRYCLVIVCFILELIKKQRVIKKQRALK